MTIDADIQLNDLRLRILNNEEVTASEMRQVVDALQQGRLAKIREERKTTAQAKKASTPKAKVEEIPLDQLMGL